MKSKRKIILLLLLPLCLGAGEKYERNFPSLACTGALTKINGDKNESLELKLNVIAPEKYKVVSRLYNHLTNALLFSSTFERVLLRGITKFTVDYPLRYRINSDGLRFSFEVTFKEDVREFTGVLYPYVSKTINASYYKNSIYSTENAFLRIINNRVITGEDFSFENFNEYLTKHTNNYLDFSSVAFNYLPSYAFTYLKAEYHIKDYNNVYPDLPKVDDEIVLNMICVDNSGEISFKLNEELYVNQTTLEMAKTKLPNYVATNQLYVPIGKEELFGGDDSYILVKEAGYSAIDIMLPLSFFYNKKMIGLCYNSDYCIQGGVRE